MNLTPMDFFVQLVYYKVKQNYLKKFIYGLTYVKKYSLLKP